MEKSIYKVNINYELQLQSGKETQTNPHVERIRNLLEFSYFYIENSRTGLATNIQYPKQYLKNLENLGFNIPSFHPYDDPKAKNWWGAFEDPEREQILNSKIQCVKVGKILGVSPPQLEVCQNSNELEGYLGKISDGQQIFCRTDFSAGGSQNLTIVKEDLLQQLDKVLKKGFQIFCPKLNKVFDLGILFDLKEENLSPYLYLNLLNAQGNYKGSLFFENQERIFQFLHQFGLNGREEFMSLYRPIVDQYISTGAKDFLQIDSFVYQENKKFELYSLVEVNYRKSLGLLGKSLIQFLPKDGVGLWMIDHEKNFKNLDQIIEMDSGVELKSKDLIEKEFALELTPKNHFSNKAIFLSDHSFPHLVKRLCHFVLSPPISKLGQINFVG